MKKSDIDLQNANILIRARVAFRGFVINTLIVFVMWLLSFIPGVVFMGALMTGVPGAWFFYLMMCGLALWEMIAVIFFLVPALSYWWEYRSGR